MYIGVLIAPTEYSIRIDELARETEGRAVRLPDPCARFISSLGGRIST
jgi:hypothetical protein